MPDQFCGKLFVEEIIIHVRRMKRLATVAFLLIMPNASHAIDYNARSLEMGDEFKSGDSSIPFENYALITQFGDAPSNCNTESEDLVKPGLGSISGPYRYGCLGTTLAHGSDGVIHKFRSNVCRNGPDPQHARFKARNATFRYMDEKMIAFQRYYSEPQHLIKDRQSVVCKNYGLNGSLVDPPQQSSNGGESKPHAVTFIIHNADRYTVGLEFYSQSDSDRRWPGNGKQYNLAKEGTFNLACKPEELICFGAWRDYQTTYWGVGGLNKHSCAGCCLTCGGTLETTLTDGGADSPERPTAQNTDQDNSGSTNNESSGVSGTEVLGAAASILGAFAGVAGATSHAGSVHVSPPPPRQTYTPSGISK